MLFAMEAHPVPQNVTSFEFRLIGDMTLKQFIYLCIGAGTAYIFFVFLAIPAPFLAWPVIVISSFLGLVFVFFTKTKSLLYRSKHYPVFFRSWRAVCS